MNKPKEIMLGISAVFAALSSYLGILAVPVYMLVLLNITDYITGIFAAKYRGQEISSYKGLRGIIKKVCMLVIVAVAGAVDWLLMFAATSIGIDFKFKFYVATLVAIWLICNEIISILENIRDIGTPLPPFLLKIVQKVKDQTEQKGNEEK